MEERGILYLTVKMSKIGSGSSGEVSFIKILMINGKIKKYLGEVVRLRKVFFVVLIADVVECVWKPSLH